MCESHQGFYKHRNIYSNSSVINIVMYSFKEYGSLHFRLQISTTQYKLTTKSTYLRAFNNGCGDRRNQKRCAKLWAQTRNVDMDFIPWPRQFIFVNNEECVITHLSQDITLYMYKVYAFVFMERNCQLHYDHYVHRSLVAKIQKVTYTVMSFFEGE